jgi:hypothetical protein
MNGHRQFEPSGPKSANSGRSLQLGVLDVQMRKNSRELVLAEAELMLSNENRQQAAVIAF